MVSNPRGSVLQYNDVTIHLLKKLLHENPCPTLNNVRRNLFGIPKKEESIGQELDEQLTDLAKKSSEEWNFDFLNELPKTGRYVWQRVHAYDVPVWYAAVSRPSMKDNCRQKHEENSEPEDPCAYTDFEASNKINELENSEESFLNRSSKRPHLVQTSMKDFTRIQKRRSSCRLRMKRLDLPKMRRHSHYWTRRENAIR